MYWNIEKMKTAVVTRSDENIKSISDLTHPFLKKYAFECGADFIILDQEPIIWVNNNRPHYRILKCQNLLNTYQRLLLLDTDMLILPNCPNIFKEVPYDYIGSIFEDKGGRKPDRMARIKDIQNQWGNIGWENGYTNAGTFVLSDCHKHIFDSNNGEYWKGRGSVDVHLSYMARKNNYKFHELSYKWNHMTMFSERWNNYADRFNSYIIHYAGRGFFDKNINDRILQIKYDLQKINKIK